MAINITEMVERRNTNPYKGQYVEFEYSYELDKAATAAANGQPKYKEVEILLVHNGRDKTPVLVTDYHKQLYPEKYAAFVARKEQPVDGTPLKEWPIMPRTVVLELAHIGIKTVEQLANANGDQKKLIGTQAHYVKKAKAWLEASESNQASVVQLREELEKERTARKSLEEQMVKLMARIEANEGVKLLP